MFKAYGYSLYYSLVGIWWKIFDHICAIEAMVSTEDFNHSIELKHDRFHEFLSEIEAEYPEWPY